MYYWLTISLFPGTPRGSYYSPVELGGAGSCSYGSSVSPPANRGGLGGGSIHWRNARQFLIDGTIQSQGEASMSGVCGGGAGGSVWIETESISGWILYILLLLY